jgi:two-component system, chemotaxis family, protein-glutamate methylesterase/glutaminase
MVQSPGRQARDVVVVGGSAGSVQALIRLVGGLPPDLPAAMLVVVHTPTHAVSRLPEILGRAGPLPAAHAVDGEPLRPGRIYVAPPNRHLLLQDGRIVLSRGPRENHSRPAIDPLFRSAARARGPHVIGVILSGVLHDGSMGLLAVKNRGGLAIVQDPDEAIFDSMPRSAIRQVSPDVVLPAADISGVLAQAITEGFVMSDPPSLDDDQRMDSVIVEDFQEQASNDRSDRLTVYSCPDCGGAIWQSGDESALQFRCHVGHRFAPEMMEELKSDELESALWMSLRLLKEKSTLSRQMAERFRAAGNPATAERARERAALDERHAEAIQSFLDGMLTPPPPAWVGDSQNSPY